MAAPNSKLPLLIIILISLILHLSHASAQTSPLSLAQEHAAAKDAGLEISAAAISPPLPPTDAFDDKPLHYEVTATGFVISATHQRPGHKPEPTIFRYSL